MKPSLTLARLYGALPPGLRAAVPVRAQIWARGWLRRALNPEELLLLNRAAVRDEAVLRAEYRAQDISRRADDFVLYRIVGNDLHPRHASGQSRANLRFVIENEPPLADCAKRWIVNRIVDQAEEARILELLAAHGQDYLRLPFVAAEYRGIGWDTAALPAPGFLASRKYASLDPEARDRVTLTLYRLKNNYVMNNNGARNAALRDGRDRAKWILPWDGNCFVTPAAWDALRAAVLARPHLKYFVVPMARIPDNSDLLRGDFAPSPLEEPQVLMRSDAAEAFDPAFSYGRRPKVELFWRLGIPGKWDLWRDDPWDPPRRPRSDEARQFGVAGWVARLSSGQRSLEHDDAASFKNRGLARQRAIVATLNRIDDGLENPDDDEGGLVFYSTRALVRLGAAGGSLADAILAGAEAALTRGPFSVIDKTTLPPSRNRRDYWHPAPYWWPNPYIPGGLPYVQRDGERVPGTRMYEPESGRYDRTRLQRLIDDTTSLALAWHLTGRGDFAAHAVRNIAAWFIAPETRMTPHLRYAQVRMGRNRGQGTGGGIIEFKDVYYFLDAVRILRRGGALDTSVGTGLSVWLRVYLAWLTTSPQGARESASTNNHGTYFDLQTAAIAAYLGERDLLRSTLVRAQSRLTRQITPEGAQPEELRRTTTAHYCLFNLQGWMALLRIGRRTGVIRPDFTAEPWMRLAKATAWVLDHDLANWPYPQIDRFDPERGLPLAAHALENGIGDLGKNTAALRARGFEGDGPVFPPHDGIAPYWALAGPESTPGGQSALPPATAAP